MKYNLINTGNCLLVVDDSEIKDGDYTYQEASNIISTYNNAYSKKIISHLPFNNLPILEGVPLLSPLEDDVEKLAHEEYPESDWDDSHRSGFKAGYYTARYKHKYTEEDLLRLLYWADSDERLVQGEKFSDFLQSLQKPKIPFAFECEMERVFKHNEHMEREFYEVPKTITNSEGRTEWVGKYIYE
jgi:hypothetical protein